MKVVFEGSQHYENKQLASKASLPIRLNVGFSLCDGHCTKLNDSKYVCENI